jgi:hypothetical protein
MGGELVEYTCDMSNRGAYDPTTVEFLRTVLDEAWDAMATKSRLANRISRNVC